MNCAIADLSVYQPSSAQAWDRPRAIHLYRRMQFGATIQTVQAALQQSPTAVVDDLIQAALATPYTPVPDFADKPQSAYGLALLESILERDGYAREWIGALQGFGLRGRMELFWHNHFVTRFDVYESSSYLYQYHRLLQEYALGDFREFVRRIGLTPAMLVFLNGTQNAAGAPNENYARELYELFTLGVDNGYTQTDVEETARALTGYTNVTEPWGPILFDPAAHDDGAKTIFGQTDNWGYDDVIDLLFEQRGPQVARFIAGKLYRHFVNPAPHAAVIEQLADVFAAADWNIAALLRALFQSAHFFDDANVATIIPGHLEHQLIFYTEVGIPVISSLTAAGIYGGITEHGQALFNPVDVAGWPGNRAWINTTSLIYRRNTVESQLGLLSLLNYGNWVTLVQEATDATQDVELVCEDLVRYFIPKGLQYAATFEAALLNFQGEIPQNYFDDGTWTVDYYATPFQLAGLLRFLNQLPEFQLK